MTTQVDHLVVAAATLAQGAAWCEATLGVTPGPGGRHALMGTHNRLLSLASPAYPLAFLEIIAIDPDAPPPGRARWFGLDEPALQARIAVAPRLVHGVARTAALDAHRAGLVAAGAVGDDEPGVAIAVSRDTPAGRLHWRILVRDDGRLPFGGALPTLIEWQGGHPAAAMPPSGLTLRALTLGGLPAAVLAALDLADVSRQPASEPALSVTLATPRGEVVLTSD